MDKNKQAIVQRILSKKNNDKGGGSRKYGRNLAKCKLYRERRFLKNKLAKIKKHRANHPNDKVCADAYERILSIK